MKRLLVAIAAAMTIVPAYSQTKAPSPSIQAKAGELIRLGPNVTLKVGRSTGGVFSGVKVKGEPIVVVLDFESQAKGEVTFSYRTGADAKTSETYLTSGAQRLAPRATMQDFPSWGEDNDKDVDVLDPDEGVSADTVSFEGKGSVYLLFDVPPSLAKSPKTLSITLRMAKPTVAERTLSVSM